MPTNTTRLSLVIPSSTDNESIFPSQATTTYNILDATVTVTEGTLASRPSGSYYGQTYYATDTGQWFFYTGSAWEAVHVSGAWVNLTLATNVAATAGGYTPAARLVGDSVWLCGGLTSNSSFAGGTLATIPVGLRPASTVAITASPILTASTGGVIGSGTAGGPFTYPLEGSNFRLV